MTRVAAALLAACVAAAPPALAAQTARVAVWGSYEGVTGSDDWTTAGAQLTLASPRGHALWAAAELVGRFGERDGVERVGGVLHPATRWWFTFEAGTAVGPELVPKNSWEADVAALVSRRASFGLGYRRQNYVVGPVDLVIPHGTLRIHNVSWDLRAFVSQNPSDRTDLAFFVRAMATLSGRAAAWLGGGAGRESYLVGAPPVQQVRSLETVTGTAGVRIDTGSGFTVRADATVVRSRPVLSRRGLALAIERQL